MPKIPHILRFNRCLWGILAFLACIGTVLSCAKDQMTAPESAPSISTGSKKIIPPGLVLTKGGLSAAEFQYWRSLRGSADSLAWVFPYGASLQLPDDDCIQQELGYSFEFYETAYADIWINTNGNLTFNDCLSDWWHPDIPDEANALIAPLYGDFDPSVSGDIHLTTVGIEPYRRFVVTWAGLPEFSQEGDPTSAPSTFQALLYEDSHQIQFGYNELGTDGIQWSYLEPSNDSLMDVGISSGLGSFINTATGPAILGLDLENICYVPDGDGYLERREPCILFDPQCPDSLDYIRGPVLEDLRNLWNRSNPVSGPPAGSLTRERGGWIYIKDGQSKLQESTHPLYPASTPCRSWLGAAPPGVKAGIHTHPLAPGRYPNTCDREIWPAADGPSSYDRGAAVNAGVPIEILERHRLVHVNIDSITDSSYCGCINGTPPPQCLPK